MIAQRLAECNREVVLVVDEALVTEDLVDAIAADGHDLTTLAWVNRELQPGEDVPPHLIVDVAGHACCKLGLRRAARVARSGDALSRRWIRPVTPVRGI